MHKNSLIFRALETALGKSTGQCAAVLLAGYITARIISDSLWVRHINLIHTSLELVCIFIALSSFLTMWYTYPLSSPVNHLIGFGFLIVAVFDSFHTYYFAGLNLYPKGFFDLSAWYWLLGRFTEAAVLLLSTYKPGRLRVNKWAGLLFAVALAGGSAPLFLNLPWRLPVLFDQDGLTPLKIVLEYMIICLFVAGIFRIRKRISDQDAISYRYIFCALLIAVPAELCFTLFKSITSFYTGLGHILRIAYYYYLFRGIFVSAVTYPHKRLEEAGRMMTDILNGLPVGLVTYDSEGRLSFINDRALEIAGVREREVLGLTAEELDERFYGAAPDRIPVVRQILQTGQPVRNRIKTIESGHALSRKVRIDAQILSEGGALLLITEAKKEQELENLQLQTRAILNSLSNIAVITDKKGYIIMCNGAFENTFGISAEEARGASLAELYRRLGLTNPGHTPEPSPGEGLGPPVEASFVTTGGIKKNLVLQSVPILNIDREIIGGIMLASDITDLKKEQQVLQQREKLALLGEMAAGVVHEIKNPLTTIKGFSHIITSKTGDEEIRNYASIIESTANDVNKVVSDFLAFARPRSPMLKEVSLRRLIQSIRTVLESHLFLNRIEARFNLSGEERPVMADDSQIRQAVLNIIKNSIDALKETENPLLLVSTRRNEKGDEMQIIITDNGRGMTSEDRSKIGTPFFTTKDKGPGLGLSICYQIVNEHSGRISVESEPGKGTTFTISLPCTAPSQTAVVPPGPRGIAL